VARFPCGTLSLRHAFLAARFPCGTFSLRHVFLAPHFPCATLSLRHTFFAPFSRSNPAIDPSARRVDLIHAVADFESTICGSGVINT
jgi:hypothetical protein